MNELAESAVRLAQSSTLPLWVMVIAVVGALIKIVPPVIERLNDRRKIEVEARAQVRTERNNIIELQWARLQDEIKRLAGRVESLEAKCDTLSLKVEECEEDRDHWRSRAISAEAAHAKLEAVMTGLGEVDQMAARVVAADRLEQRRGDKG